MRSNSVESNTTCPMFEARNKKGSCPFNADCRGGKCLYFGLDQPGKSLLLQEDVEQERLIKSWEYNQSHRN